jgi:DNA polymerase
MYNEIVPTLEIIEKMIKNETDPSKLTNFVDATFPTLKLKLLSNDIHGCTACDLYPCNHVSFKGNIDAEIMMVGSAPSAFDEKEGTPFSGPSGTLLKNMVIAAGDKIDKRWNMENIHLTNVVKCHPKAENGSTREPSVLEIAECKKYIDKEIALVKPKLIICFGSVASKTLIHKDFDMDNDHGKIYGDEIKIIGTYHPGLVALRGEGSEEGVKTKLAMWDDITKANSEVNW